MNKEGIIQAFEIVLRDFRLSREKAEAEADYESKITYQAKEKILGDVICFIAQNLDEDTETEKALQIGQDVVILKKNIRGWTWILKDRTGYYFNVITHYYRPIRVNLTSVEANWLEAQEMYNHMTMILKREFCIVD